MTGLDHDLDNAIKLLILAAAHGKRQLAVAEEIVQQGFAIYSQEYVPQSGMPRQALTMRVGKARLESKSWISMRRRLVASGFTAKLNQYRREIEVTWP